MRMPPKPFLSHEPNGDTGLAVRRMGEAVSIVPVGFIVSARYSGKACMCLMSAEILFSEVRWYRGSVSP